MKVSNHPSDEGIFVYDAVESANLLILDLVSNGNITPEEALPLINHPNPKPAEQL